MRGVEHSRAAGRPGPDRLEQGGAGLRIGARGRLVDQIYAALLDAGVPDEEVVRVERMISTLILGYAASEVGGRFGPGELDPRGRRGQLPEGALPAHARLHKWLDAPVDWNAEFEAHIDDLLRLVERIAGEGSVRRRRTRKG
jgi:hypothetical protein